MLYQERDLGDHQFETGMVDAVAAAAGNLSASRGPG
jgi:hypothetical protein